MTNIEQTYTDDEITKLAQKILRRKQASVRLARSIDRWEKGGFLFKFAFFTLIVGAVVGCIVAPLIHFGVLASSAIGTVFGSYAVGATIEPLRILSTHRKVGQAERDLEQFKADPVPAVAAALRQKWEKIDVSRIAAVLRDHPALTIATPVDLIEHLQTRLSLLSGQARSDFLAKAVKVIAPVLADAEKESLFTAQARLEDAQAAAEAAREHLSRVEMQAATSLRYVETALLPAKNNIFSNMISKSHS